VAPSKHETKSKSPRLAKTCETWGTRARTLVWVLDFSRVFVREVGVSVTPSKHETKSKSPRLAKSMRDMGHPRKGTPCWGTRAKLGHLYLCGRIGAQGMHL
jgi:hypothetical protein